MTRILVIDDNDTVREGVVTVLRRMEHDVQEASSGTKGVKLLGAFDPELVITDLKMEGLDGIGVLKKVKANRPETEVVIITAFATIENAVEAIKLGAFDYLQKPFSPDTLRLKVDRALEWIALQRKSERLAAAASLKSDEREGEREGFFEGMFGDTQSMQTLFDRIKKVSVTDSNVHVFGESGTGKELVAQAIHARSKRAQGPLVIVNCGAIPETLLESELFGHEKGAFTGAIKRKLGTL